MTSKNGATSLGPIVVLCAV